MKIKRDTLIRTIILVLALVNQILTSTGHSILPITDDQVADVITLAFTIGTSVWAWWKNNSFTKAAIEADDVMAKKKEEYKANVEV